MKITSLLGTFWQMLGEFISSLTASHLIIQYSSLLRTQTTSKVEQPDCISPPWQKRRNLIWTKKVGNKLSWTCPFLILSHSKQSFHTTNTEILHWKICLNVCVCSPGQQLIYRNSRLLSELSSDEQVIITRWHKGNIQQGKGNSGNIIFEPQD